MPPVLQWFESDGVTPLGSLALGTVGPGESYFGKNGSYRELILKNTGNAVADSVEINIQKVMTFAIDEYLQVAYGVTPGAFSGYADPPLALGTLAPDATVQVYVDLVIPVMAARRSGQWANLAVGYVDA
ncbi:MAG: hypothetical protein H0U69_03360 [Trueperaceae bacterium]|nr:hypothetical protein [Trueperaceae bacterium]